MNPGGEPERDDTGLPPVDIEIPDDARDLDRDVQAYYRELRAVRRRERRTRWHPSFSRDGIVLPLLACCLILALITGTLLTVFTATSYQGLDNGTRVGGAPGHSPAHRPATSGQATTSQAPTSQAPKAVTSPTPTQVSWPVPAATLDVNGTLTLVQSLQKAMLVLVPAGCACASTLDWLATAARTAHATAYLVYTQRAQADVQQLYRQLSGAAQDELTLAEDTDGMLTSPRSFPNSIPASQLTAILVSPQGTATYVSHLSPSESPAAIVRAIITS